MRPKSSGLGAHDFLTYLAKPFLLLLALDVGPQTPARPGGDHHDYSADECDNGDDEDDDVQCPSVGKQVLKEHCRSRECKDKAHKLREDGLIEFINGLVEFCDGEARVRHASIVAGSCVLVKPSVDVD